MNHTPGPWTMERRMNPPTGYLIQSYQGKVGMAITKPDARLIAAAPHLLEALNRIAELDAISATHAIAQLALASGIARAAIKAAGD